MMINCTVINNNEAVIQSSNKDHFFQLILDREDIALLRKHLNGLERQDETAVDRPATETSPQDEAVGPVAPSASPVATGEKKEEVKWEYYMSRIAVDSFSAHANAWGSEGWEIVSMWQHQEGNYCFFRVVFKKRKP